MGAPNCEWMVIGQIVAPFGLRGEMKIEPLTDFPERFSGLTEVFVGPDRRPVHIERARPHKRQVVLKLAGIDTPEGVAVLRGLDLAVPRSDAMRLPEGHFYLADILGMDVVVDGERLGSVFTVLRTGSNDVYVVRHGGREILIPAIKDAVTKVDFERRLITVERWAVEPLE